MPEPAIIMSATAVQHALARIAHEIVERNNHQGDGVVLVGIQRGGVFLARRLAALLEGLWGVAVPVGSMDISMYRDDLATKAAPPMHPTSIPFPVEAKTVILVDDVLFSGRTIRAALDALNDFGRPRCVQLAVLVDRGHRELPIKADFVGKNLPTARKETITVHFREAGEEDSVTLEKP